MLILAMERLCVSIIAQSVLRHFLFIVLLAYTMFFLALSKVLVVSSFLILLCLNSIISWFINESFEFYQIRRNDDKDGGIHT